MASDFNPQDSTEERTKTTGNRIDRQFFPADGSIIVVAYINPAPGQASAIASLLAQIEAKCSGFEKKIWNPVTSVAGKRAMVDVGILVSKKSKLV